MTQRLPLLEVMRQTFPPRTGMAPAWRTKSFSLAITASYLGEEESLSIRMCAEGHRVKNDLAFDPHFLRFFAQTCGRDARSPVALGAPFTPTHSGNRPCARRA